MKSKTLIALTVLTLAAGVGFSKNARAFCLFATDCPGGAATVSVEIDPSCHSDADCPYGEQCNTATGACFTPSSATMCACAPDGDLCTDDAGVPSATGGCFCPYNRLTTPECSKTDGDTPSGTIKPGPWYYPDPIVVKDPIDPADPVDPAPTDPEPLPTPPSPPVVNVPAEDTCAKLPAEYRDCCRDVKGDPILVMKECVDDETRASDCDIVVNVMGGLGDKAQMNVCCNVLNNSGTVADSKIVQECRNTLEEAPAAGTTAPSGDGVASAETGADAPTAKELSASRGADGCTLTPGSGPSAGYGAVLAALAVMTLFLLRIVRKGSRKTFAAAALFFSVGLAGCQGGAELPSTFSSPPETAVDRETAVPTIAEPEIVSPNENDAVAVAEEVSALPPAHPTVPPVADPNSPPGTAPAAGAPNPAGAVPGTTWTIENTATEIRVERAPEYTWIPVTMISAPLPTSEPKPEPLSFTPVTMYRADLDR